MCDNHFHMCSAINSQLIICAQILPQPLVDSDEIYVIFVTLQRNDNIASLSPIQNQI